MAGSGKLPSFRIGRFYKIPKDCLLKFWLSPSYRTIKNKSAVQKADLMAIDMIYHALRTEGHDREEKLSSLPEGKEKQLFLDFCNAWSEINGATAVSKFIIGFKLGLQFTAEALKEDWDNDL